MPIAWQSCVTKRKKREILCNSRIRIGRPGVRMCECAMTRLYEDILLFYTTVATMYLYTENYALKGPNEVITALNDYIQCNKKTEHTSNCVDWPEDVKSFINQERGFTGYGYPRIMASLAHLSHVLKVIILICVLKQPHSERLSTDNIRRKFEQLDVDNEEFLRFSRRGYERETNSKRHRSYKYQQVPKHRLSTKSDDDSIGDDFMYLEK